MLRRIYPLWPFLITIILIAVFSLFGPSDQTLGSNVRIVYLHGAWVLTAEFVLGLAGLAGLIALITRRDLFYHWSTALGRTGVFFWITYLPLSIWAMQANWNGLFLAEPRFRLAVTFAIVGVLLQIGLRLIDINWLTSVTNFLYIIVLLFEFSRAQYVMHPPPSPIFNSGNWQIIGFFIALNLIVWLAAYFMVIWFLRFTKE